MSISSDALSGFAGVLAGSLITGGFQFVLARRDERRDARSARLLVHSELSGLASTINWGMWSLLAEGAAPLTAMWDQYRAPLARELQEGDWKAIDRAYLNVRGVLWRINSQQEVKREVANRAVESARSALAALEPNWPVDTGGLAPDPQPPGNDD